MVEYANVIGGSLNLRIEKSSSAEKLTQIPNGTKVAITEHEDEWCKVVYNSYTGYAMTKYLIFENTVCDNSIAITLSRDCALELYKALKLSLNV